MAEKVVNGINSFHPQSSLQQIRQNQKLMF